MTRKEFNRALAHTRLQERGRLMAYDILVKGKGPKAAGETHGASRSTANAAAAAIRRKHKELTNCPDDGLLITVCVPNTEAAIGRIRAAEKTAREED